MNLAETAGWFFALVAVTAFILLSFCKPQL